MKKWLFNPFQYIAGAKALLIGLVFMIVTAIISYYSTANFHGVLSVHSGLKAPLIVFFLEQLSALVCSVLIFYCTALIFSQSAIRFIDIAGTLALARWPMIIIAMIILIPVAGISGPGDITAAFIIVELLSIIVLIWVIALMYNAFKVSGNLKGETAVIVFIAAILVAEILANYISYQLVKHIV